MILQNSFKLGFAKVFHEITRDIGEMLRWLNQIMDLMEPLTVVIIQMQQKVFCLVHLMNEEVLWNVITLIAPAQIRLVSYIILFRIQPIWRVIREHAHKLVKGWEVSAVKVSRLYVHLSLVVWAIQETLFNDVFFSDELTQVKVLLSS